MSEPVPLSKDDRTFSFGNDLDLSLSVDGKPVAETGGSKSGGGSSPPVDVERSSSFRKGPPRLSRGSVHFHPEPVKVGPLYDSSPSGTSPTYSNSSFSYGESSKSPLAERDIGEPTEGSSDYDIFLQKSREDYERDKQRNWPTVEIDDASFTNLPSQSKNEDRRKLFATARKILRVLQVLTSLVVVSMVSLTISKVRETSNLSEGLEQDLWHDPLILWPEYLVAAVSGLSFLTSLLSVMAILFIDKLSETKGRLGLMANFCLNLLLLVGWIIAVIVLKVNSSTDFVWGFACAHSGNNIPIVDYSFICNRETVTWAISILSTVVESGISIAFIFTFLRHQAYQAEKAEARRQANMRMSVHRAMTGRGSNRKNFGKRISQGWEAGGENVRPVINMHAP